MGVKDETIGDFLESLAAATPTPGGGSASALVGALSAALSRMVLGLARGKKGYEAVQGELQEIEAQAKSVQARLEALVDEDSRAYEAVVAAMHMPKASDGERTARVEAVQVAYQKATMVPLETIERCVEVLQLAEQAAEKGSRGASTDAGVAVVLAEAAIRGASLNCRVNLASIKDESFRGSTEDRLAALLKRADEIGHRAIAVVEGRL